MTTLACAQTDVGTADFSASFFKQERTGHTAQVSQNDFELGHKL